MVDHQKIASDLKTLSPSNPSLYKQLSRHYSDIEAAIKNGASYNDLITKLRENGIVISKDTFTKYLYRMRLKSGRKPRPIKKRCPVQRVFWDLEHQELPPDELKTDIEQCLQFVMPEKYKDWFYTDPDSSYGFFTYDIPKGTRLNQQLHWILDSIKDWNFTMAPENYQYLAEEHWNTLQMNHPTDRT